MDRMCPGLSQKLMHLRETRQSVAAHGSDAHSHSKGPVIKYLVGRRSARHARALSARLWSNQIATLRE